MALVPSFPLVFFSLIAIQNRRRETQEKAERKVFGFPCASVYNANIYHPQSVVSSSRRLLLEWCVSHLEHFGSVQAPGRHHMVRTGAIGWAIRHRVQWRQKDFRAAHSAIPKWKWRSLCNTVSHFPMDPSFCLLHPSSAVSEKSRRRSIKVEEWQSTVELRPGWNKPLKAFHHHPGGTSWEQNGRLALRLGRRQFID